jgi:acylphosphatase
LTDPLGDDPAETMRRRVHVSGRVQGVWFRESCRDEAERAGVDGWVRNLADGRVEVVLEGPRAEVDRVVAWCHRGPRRARVDRVEVVDEVPVGERGFRVR